MGFRFRSLQRPRGAVVLASALVLCSCTAVKHGYSTGDYSDQTLATNSRLGAERLSLEMAYDEAVADFVSSHGKPAYIHVADRDRLYLFYPERDLAVSIQRELLPPGEVVVNERIPGHFFRLLPPAEVRRLQARRAAKNPTDPIVRRPPRSVAPPAAPTATGVNLRAFDPDAMVARLRVPLSAADEGVSGWRVTTLENGVRTRIAHSGRTEYRIQRNAVIAVGSISSRSRSVPAGTRTATIRINRAVFGTRADAVTRSTAPLVARVAADPSGRTRVVRRVEGRTLSVTRDIKRGLLVYRVAAD